VHEHFAGAGTAAPDFDPRLRYELAPDVALRAEPFGALAYNYANRRLTFLRSVALRELVRALSGFETAGDAVRVSVPPDAQPSYMSALASLAKCGMIRAC
jgi:putative mycofactocin binding protein MftB